MTAEPASHKARIELFQERARTTSGTLQGGLAVVALLALLVVQLPGTAWGKSLFIGETCLVYNSPAVELAALGFFDSITEFDLSGGTPTLPQLQAHDVALIYTNCTPFDPNSLGDVLADYVDAGGRTGEAHAAPERGRARERPRAVDVARSIGGDRLAGVV